jgi:hypothetical protein
VMLVFYREAMEQPEGMALWRPVPSLVGLFALDDGLGSIAHTVDLQKAAASLRTLGFIDSPELSPIDKDRKFGIRIRRAPSGDNKLPGQVVECRAEIVESIPDHSRALRRWWIEHVPFDLNVVRIEIDKGMVGVTFKKAGDFPIECLKVRLCPLKLQDRPVKRMHNPDYGAALREKRRHSPAPRLPRAAHEQQP